VKKNHMNKFYSNKSETPYKKLNSNKALNHFEINLIKSIKRKKKDDSMKLYKVMSECVKFRQLSLIGFWTVARE